MHGDWICVQCGDHVFASRSSCRRCGVSRQPPSVVAASPSSGSKPGDWKCPGCSGLVFASKSVCRKCGTCKPDSGPTALAGVNPGGRPGDWTCHGCNFLVFASKSQCSKCGSARPSTAYFAAPVAASERTGSASSAPALASDWTCPNCADHVFARNSACRKCKTPRPQPSQAAVAAVAAASTSAATAVAGAGTQGAVRAGDWQCPNCKDLQFARNSQCRRCGTDRPQWLGADLSLKPPDYWTTVQDAAWSVVPVDDTEMAAFKVGFVSGGTLGGRDQRTALDYTGFSPYCAWRLQHPGLWGKYAMERENLRKLEMASLQKHSVQLPDIRLRQPFKDMATMLPSCLDDGLRETYLSHGSKPDSLLAILSGGLNERFSGGLFGNGTYLAEDIAKNDQYCTYDEKHGDHPELHKLLFDDARIIHPGSLLYVFVCRVMLGHAIRTKDGQTDLEDDARRSIWSSKGRELITIPKTSPPLLHHSLLVEVGGKVARYREFIVFHGDRIYPEYLVAYQRNN